MIFDCRGREGLIVDPDLGEPAAEVRPFTAMIFAVAAAFAVGWLTGSHAGYTAGAESEHVRIDARATLPEAALPVEIVERVRSSQPASGVDGSDTEAAWTAALAAHLGGEAEQEIDGVVAGRVDVLTGTQAIELDWLKGNKFHEGIGQALHYGDVTGQQPVLALISAYYDIFGAERQKLKYVSRLCAANGVEVWALTTKRE